MTISVCKRFPGSVTTDDNPEGINQYTGGSPAKAEEASQKAALARAAATQTAPNAPGKADAHREAAKLSRTAARAHRDANQVPEMKFENAAAETHERLEQKFWGSQP